MIIFRDFLPEPLTLLVDTTYQGRIAFSSLRGQSGAIIPVLPYWWERPGVHLSQLHGQRQDIPGEIPCSRILQPEGSSYPTLDLIGHPFQFQQQQKARRIALPPGCIIQKYSGTNHHHNHHHTKRVGHWIENTIYEKVEVRSLKSLLVEGERVKKKIAGFFESLQQHHNTITRIRQRHSTPRSWYGTRH
eukprot:scaffold2219_cov177-Amphora_coffeaeformis.AAC.1